MDAKLLMIVLISLLIATLPTKSLAQLRTEERVVTYNKMETDDFNRLVEKSSRANESWAKSPMLIALKFVGEFEEATSRIVEIVQRSPEENDAVTVMITDEGLADDSLRGEKYKLELKRGGDDVWKITKALKAWSCWPERGHQDYSAEQCN